MSWLESNRRQAIDVAAYCTIVTLYGYVLYTHIFWRDELHPFEIARISPGLTELFFNSRYDGHPMLWYSILWIVTRFTENPAYMQVINGLIGAGYLAIIWLASPFRLYEKIAISFSFYAVTFFIISRCYGLGLLLALLFPYVRSRWPEKKLLAWFVLGLLANVSVMSAMLSGVLALYFLYQIWQSKGRGGIVTQIPGMLLYGGCLLMAVIAVIPTADFELNPWRSRLVYEEISTLLMTFWKVDNFGIAGLLGSGVIFAILLHTFWQRKILILVIAASVAGFMLLQTLSDWPLSDRHYGVLYAAIIVCWYFYRLQVPAAGLNIPFITILSLNFSQGIGMLLLMWQMPYSNIEHTAHWIKQRGLQDMYWVGILDAHTAPVSALLQRPFYYPECNCKGTYVEWSKYRAAWQRAHEYSWKEEATLEKVLRETMDNTGRKDFYLLANDFYFLGNKGRTEKTVHIGAFRLQVLARFDRESIIGDERYVAYHVHYTP